MLIALDIGNTNIVIGVFSNNKLSHNFRIVTDKKENSSDLKNNIEELLVKNKIDISLINGAILSSVVPSLTTITFDVIIELFGFEPIVVDHNIISNMPILIDYPEELGSDRIVNSVGAFSKYKKSLIVIDFGTATTFDCISSKCEYLGGVIAPGLEISSKALSKSASKLPVVELKRPRAVIGKNTVDCMQSGLIHGYSSLVDGMGKKLESEMSDKPYVLATGGLADLIASETDCIMSVDNNLTLDGLKILYELNS